MIHIEERRGAGGLGLSGLGPQSSSTPPALAADRATRLRRALLAATLLGFAARLAVALLFPIAPAKDDAEYHDLALRLSRGEGYTLAGGAPTAFRPPGLPFLLASVYTVAGPEPVAGRAALAAIGALAVPLVGLVALEVGGALAALVAAFAAALYPPFVTSYYSPRALLAEVPLTTFALLALWLAGRAHRQPAPGRRVALAASAGLAAAAALLTKGTLLFLPPALAGFQALAPRRRRERVLAAAAVLAGAAALAAPWMLRNHALFGAWVPVSTNGGISVWASYNPASRGLGNGPEGYWAIGAEDDELDRQGLDEAERSRYFMARARAEIAARPARAARLVLRKTLLFFDPSVKDGSNPGAAGTAYNWAYGMALPLALYGAVLGLRRQGMVSVSGLLLGFAVAVALLHILLHTDIRYRVALEPVLLAFAGVAVADRTARHGRRHVLGLGLVYTLAHAAIARSYADVFALLSSAVRAAGLG